MMTKTMMLIAISVGIMMSRRWTMYPSMPVSARRRGRRQRRLLVGCEPERVRAVHAEMSARVPVVDALVRNVAQLVVDHHGLRHAGDQPDRRDLIGMDGENLLPDRLAIGFRFGVEPLAEERQQVAAERHIWRIAGAALGLGILPPFRPLELLR